MSSRKYKIIPEFPNGSLVRIKTAEELAGHLFYTGSEQNIFGIIGYGKEALYKNVYNIGAEIEISIPVGTEGLLVVDNATYGAALFYNFIYKDRYVWVSYFELAKSNLYESVGV